MMLLPISNLMIQAGRVHSFYRIASQAKPYNHIVRYMKHASKALIDILLILLICAMVWMQGRLIYGFKKKRVTQGQTNRQTDGHDLI